MPIYQDDNSKICVTDFGNGRMLEIRLKDSFGSVESARHFIALSKKANAAERSIAKLEAKQNEGVPLEEFNKLQAQIEEWRVVPDNLTILVDFIYAAGTGWDNYPNREAEQRGEELPFTKENIGNIHIKRLNKIAGNLLAMMGLTEEDEDPKASPSKSESQLFLENTVQ